MSVYYGENKIKAMRKGTQRAIAIYKGSRLIFQEKMAVVADSQHVTLEGLPEFVLFNDPLVVSVAPEEGYALISVQVIMNGEDITNEVYANNTIAIPEVKGEVSIAALASPPIVFEDEAVKAICVENWGGNYIEGEITEYEASVVTSLNDKFYNNTAIYKFNELRYFTGLTTLYSRIISGYPAGQFYGCRNLTEVTIPTADISSFSGAFKQCVKLKELDLTPTTSSVLALTCVLQITTANASCKKLKLPSCKVSSGFNNLIFYRTGLTRIEIEGVLDLSEVTAYAGAFGYCNALTTITGIIVGIKAGMSFSSSPLTRETALVILNGLVDGETGTITFSDTTMALLTEDDIAIGTDKGWTITAA